MSTEFRLAVVRFSVRVRVKLFGLKNISQDDVLIRIEITKCKCVDTDPNSWPSQRSQEQRG